MWFFKRKQAKVTDLAIRDTQNEVYLTDDCYYQLSSPDVSEEHASLQRITKVLDKWLLLDQISDTGNSGHENTLSYQLVTLDVKFLPHQPELLAMPLQDNEYSRNASRFFDMINYLYMTEPSWIFSLLTGRFIYSQLYVLPRTFTVGAEDTRELPNRQEWANFLAMYPWVPLLVILQHRYDELVLQTQTHDIEDINS